MSASAQSKNNKRVNLDRCTNFMRQFRDPESRELTKLSANQFMDVWSHYDKDGEFACLTFVARSFMMLRSNSFIAYKNELINAHLNKRRAQ